MNGLDARGVWFVTRQKRNMKMTVVRELRTPAVATDAKKTQTLKDEIVVPAKESTAAKYTGTLRRATAVVEIQGQMKEMMFLTNNLKWSARTVAEVYRDRWGIETFFKELKQTCQIHDFIGYSENAVQWQVWTGLLASCGRRPRYALDPSQAGRNPVHVWDSRSRENSVRTAETPVFPGGSGIRPRRDGTADVLKWRFLREFAASG